MPLRDQLLRTGAGAAIGSGLAAVTSPEESRGRAMLAGAALGGAAAHLPWEAIPMDRLKRLKRRLFPPETTVLPSKGGVVGLLGSGEPGPSIVEQLRELHGRPQQVSRMEAAMAAHPELERQVALRNNLHHGFALQSAMLGAGAGGVMGGVSAGEGNRFEGAASGAATGALLSGVLGHVHHRLQRDGRIPNVLFDNMQKSVSELRGAAPRDIEAVLARSRGTRENTEGALRTMALAPLLFGASQGAGIGTRIRESNKTAAVLDRCFGVR